MYCSACDEVLGDNITIPATGVHTEVSIPGREATCPEGGLTEGKKGSVCGEILVAQQKDPAKGHTEVKIPGKEATCTETGLTAKRGDRLITLVTCASHTDNGRFVVVAREKRS